MKSIKEFELDFESECKHFRQKASKGFDNLSVNFCTDCGLIFITYYGEESDRTFYITPYEVWKLFNYKFNIME